MEVQYIVSLQELHLLSTIHLPESILGKKIELSNPEAITEHDFFMQYDEKEQLLIVRYITLDSDWFDFWEYMDVGQLIDGRNTDLEEEIASLNEDKQLFFLIETYEHSDVKHYPVKDSDDITTNRWNAGSFSSIFIPSKSFIEACNNDKTAIFESLNAIFESYSDWCNGYVYVLHEDTYQTDSTESILFIDNHDSVYGYIGYENASECLKSSF